MISRDAIIAAALGCCVAVLYLLTAAPGVQYTDSGELAAACTTFGVAHPTGYPLFTLLGHVWTLLPWSSPISGLNILAALLVASGVALTYLVARVLVARVAPTRDVRAHDLVAAGTALLVGCSATVWAQATSIEVYALNFVLLAGTLYATLRSIESDNHHRWTMLAGLMFGLMLTNHVSSVTLAPGFVLLWLSGSQPRSARLRSWKHLVFPAVAALALYAILPLRSAQEPPINWGMVHRDMHAFLYHVKGKQFGVWLYESKAAFNANVRLFWNLLTSQMLWIGLAPMAIGIVTLLRQSRVMGLALLAVVIGNLAISLGYGIPDIDAYFIPSLTVLTLFVGVGAAALAQRIGRQLIVAALPLILAIAVGAVEYEEQDRGHHEAVDGYTDWAMANVEPRALILTRQWDYLCSSLWYRQQALGMYSDVVVIDKELLRRTWYAPYLLQRYPDVFSRIQPTVDAYMAYLEVFEREPEKFEVDRTKLGKSGMVNLAENQRNVQMIQERFVVLIDAILRADTTRPVYVTAELLNEPEPMLLDYQRIPAGPFVRLLRPDQPQRDRVDGIDRMMSVITQPRQRLDSALQVITLSQVASNALYQLDGRMDTAAFRRYRAIAQRIQPTHPITRQLQSVLP
jgi:hypothetical protein